MRQTVIGQLAVNLVGKDREVRPVGKAGDQTIEFGFRCYRAMVLTLYLRQNLNLELRPKLLDRAGWHTTPALRLPKNVSLLFLPSRAPELNPTENVWQYLRQTYLSNRVFRDYDHILDAACDAWNRLIDSPWIIMSIGLRQWAHGGHSQ